MGHPVSVRLGLIKVMCKNIAKSVTATEAKTNNLTQIQILMGEFLVDGSEVDVSPAAVQVDGKDAN